MAGAGVSTPRALIIGGSLAGMFAAHLLRVNGWRVDVYERSAEDLAGRGAGLGSHEALVAILKRIGIDMSAPLGVPIPRYVWLDRDGGVVADVPRPRLMTAWSRIYRPLKDLLPGELYHPAKSLVRVEQDERSVTAIFADGTRETGDLLIGADGSRSAVRTLFAPQAKPEYAGYIAWRALWPEAEATPAQRELLYSRNAFCIPDGELWVSYSVPARDGDVTPGKRDYNIVWYRPADEAALADMNTDAQGRQHEQIPPPLIRADVIDAVKQAAHEQIAPSLAEIFAAARPYFQPIYDLAAPELVFGRAIIMGDAAFVARPHVGAGVTKAALDAACLADALQEHDSIEAALAHYGRTRKAAGDWIISRAREFGAVCIHGEKGRPGRMQRAERAWQEYLHMPDRIHEWGLEALAAE
jgi:2-polyprenyl-6-methoxyphenol hydroxylase-like FAD-dependent oxidoreductase